MTWNNSKRVLTKSKGKKEKKLLHRRGETSTRVFLTQPMMGVTSLPPRFAPSAGSRTGQPLPRPLERPPWPCAALDTGSQRVLSDPSRVRGANRVPAGGRRFVVQTNVYATLRGRNEGESKQLLGQRHLTERDDGLRSCYS